PGRHPEKFRVQAPCDIYMARPAAVADEFSIPWCITSFDELLRLDDIDIVDICTPAALHFSQILAALSAGKEVVCEKPLVVSLAEIDRLIVGRRTGHADFSVPLRDGVKKVKRIIVLGITGRPYLATVETAWKP